VARLLQLSVRSRGGYGVVDGECEVVLEGTQKAIDEEVKVITALRAHASNLACRFWIMRGILEC